MGLNLNFQVATRVLRHSAQNSVAVKSTISKPEYFAVERWHKSQEASRKAEEELEVIVIKIAARGDEIGWRTRDIIDIDELLRRSLFWTIYNLA